MPTNDKELSSEFTDDTAQRLFEKFSQPMVQVRVTPAQKQKSVGTAKIFWLRLISGTDTEENIYADLKRVLGNKHDLIVALGSTYCFKMKTALTEAEIRQLKVYYSDARNFRRLLKKWAP